MFSWLLFVWQVCMLRPSRSISCPGVKVAIATQRQPATGVACGWWHSQSRCVRTPGHGGVLDVLESQMMGLGGLKDIDRTIHRFDSSIWIHLRSGEICVVMFLPAEWWDFKFSLGWLGIVSVGCSTNCYQLPLPQLKLPLLHQYPCAQTFARAQEHRRMSACLIHLPFQVYIAWTKDTT